MQKDRDSKIDKYVDTISLMLVKNMLHLLLNKSKMYKL